MDQSLLSDVSIFSSLSEDERKHVLDLLKPQKVNYKKGQFIFRMGENVDAFGLMLSGKAFVLQEEFWGNQNILHHISEKDIFAESFACSHDSTMNVSVQAYEDCTVLFFDFRKIEQFAYQYDVACSKVLSTLLQDMAKKNIYFANKLSHVGQRSTREKLLSYLSSVALEVHINEFDIPFNRQQLADYLYVERSGLSQELSKMKKEGLLDFHKNHFILYDTKKI